MHNERCKSVMATFLHEPESEDAGDDSVPRLAPITHQTLYERVYEELRSAIMSASFAPGETLTIRGLAQQLGTSVMPARGRCGGWRPRAPSRFCPTGRSASL